MKQQVDLILQQAADLMHAQYRQRLEPHEKLAFHTIYQPTGLRITLALSDPKTGWLVEFVADVPGADQSDQEAIYLALDFLDGVLSEHLVSGREALPQLDPVSHIFENQTIYLSGSKRRPDLEAQADAVLNSAKKRPPRS